MPPFQVQNHGQEAAPNLQKPIQNHGQEAAPNLQKPIQNHGQEAISNIQDTRSSVPNNYQDYLQNFKIEILQAVREEVNKGITKNL